MPRCIYCQQERSSEFFEKVEHVSHVNYFDRAATTIVAA